LKKGEIMKESKVFITAQIMFDLSGYVDFDDRLNENVKTIGEKSEKQKRLFKEVERRVNCLVFDCDIHRVSQEIYEKLEQI